MDPQQCVDKKEDEKVFHSEEDDKSVQEKINEIKDECLKIALFFANCHKILLDCRQKQKSEVYRVVLDLIEELKTKRKNAKHMPSQTTVEATKSLYKLFLIVMQTACQKYPTEVKFPAIGVACDNLNKGYSKFADVLSAD